MKYFLLQLQIPIELINYIYHFIEQPYLTSIKNLEKIWYKRLIHKSLKFFSFQRTKMKYQLRQEEQILQSLIHEGAFKLIEDVHTNTIENAHFKVVGNFFDTLCVEKS